MIDINLIRNNKELVKENIKKKFQEDKLSLVDKIYDLDLKFREFKQKGDALLTCFSNCFVPFSVASSIVYCFILFSIKFHGIYFLSNFVIPKMCFS